MKKLLALFLFMPLCAFAIDNDTYQNSDVVINVPQSMEHHKSPIIIEADKDYVKTPQDVKHMPWSVTEKRIDYDHNGHAQYTPYALNDLNLQY